MRKQSELCRSDKRNCIKGCRSTASVFTSHTRMGHVLLMENIFRFTQSCICKTHRADLNPETVLDVSVGLLFAVS